MYKHTMFVFVFLMSFFSWSSLCTCEEPEVEDDMPLRSGAYTIVLDMPEMKQEDQKRSEHPAGLQFHGTFFKMDMRWSRLHGRSHTLY